MSEEIRIIVIDDHPLYRSGVVRTLEETDSFSVVGEGGKADDALQLAERARPDIALLDISMPGSGLKALEKLNAAHPEIKCIMLTVSEDDEDIMTAMKNGARGYVLKGIFAPELVHVVRTIAEGGSYVSPSLAAGLLAAMQEPGANRQAGSAIESLTEREEQILRLVSDGKSNKEVGRALNLQEKTIKHHMTSILQKLQVRNRVEAAVLAKKLWRD